MAGRKLAALLAGALLVAAVVVVVVIRRSGSPSGPGGSATGEPIPAAGQVPEAPPTLADPVVTGPPLAPSGCAGVDVMPETPIQPLVDANPPGSTFCLRSGIYRLQSITPKTGDTFIGMGEETVLTGAVVLTGFQSDGTTWYVDGQTQEGQVHGGCWEVERCDRPEDLFVDDRPLLHVADRDELAPGTWWFDYDADRIYLGEDPAGRRVETSTVRHAFSAVATDDVTIRSLVVEKYAQPAQFGAIQSGDFDTPPSSGWLIDGVTVRLNHGVGIAFFGNDDSTIRNSKILGNGEKGLGGAGRNLQILGNEIAFSNHQKAFDPAWDAGGTKFSNTDGLVARGNYVHDNHGPGLWTDGDNVNTLYEDNHIVRNGQDGILHEVSYVALIQRNTIESNGFERQAWCYGAGITISASSDVEVRENVVKDNFNSISGIQQQRGRGARGPYEIRGLRVHDNSVQGGSADGRSSQVGPCEDYAAGVYTAEWNIQFDRNRYFGTENTWVWFDKLSDFATWQAEGQDRSGALLPDRQLT
jgi:hypothetical protein